MGGIIAWLAGLLAVTCALESIPLALMRPARRWLKAGLICNVLTNPLLNCVLMLAGMFISGAAHRALTVFLELCVVACEALIYRLMLGESRRRCVCVSLVCNLLSYGAGLLAEYTLM